ncbi:MAG: ABC transporter ATP-binding protein [Clostridia bacterium]|nr:ABC transporter ATP-binding protein [Clostridia bacterium]
MYAVKTDKLTKFYGKNRGIEQVCLNVEEGDFYGFIGPNGAGKSTTIRLLIGLINPTAGSAEVLGKNIQKDRTEILSRIGYLPSEAMFYNGMKVRELLAYSASLRGKDCSKEAEQLCERLDLDPTRKIGQLSLGNRKKVGIACALQHDPELYILDEPTSGLDPLIQHEFFKLLGERNAKGATIFLSTHVLSEVGHYCRNAGVIREGRLLVSGDVASLVHTGAKQIVLRGTNTIPDIPGIQNPKAENDSVSFMYSGDQKQLISMLSQLDFRDINISDPSIEDVFIDFYTKEGE